MKLIEASENNPIKLTGETIWICDGKPKQSAPTIALIKNARKLVVEAKCVGCTYTALLESIDGVRFTSDFGQLNSKVQAYCTFFSNERGCLLFGTWIEGGEKWLWIVELT
jgi:hypothetical protein